MNSEKYTKWVACWGNATSISEQKEARYAKDLTLRYPVRMCFSGSRIRLHFSNLTGTEPVELTEVFLAKQNDDYHAIPVYFSGETKTVIAPGSEIVSDELSIDVVRGDTIDVSIYLSGFTQMNAGTLVTGPMSKGFFSYGNFTREEKLPRDLTRSTSWFYFLNTIDVLTEKKNHALICYGDSITALSWPDYLKLRCEKEGYENVSVIRRAVCGTRILRQYDCINYAAYGLKGEIRFPVEMNVAGSDAVIILHGINDIIHPVGVEVNEFRPWSDMPSSQDLIDGVKKLYVNHARKLGLKIYSGTLLPIFGWRTYNEERNVIRNEFNEWLRTASDFDGCVDFDLALRNPSKPEAFKDGFDSGDHLHPSEKAYETMAYTVPEELLK